jgi:DNA-binding transcriptional MerR regulator
VPLLGASASGGSDDRDNSGTSAQPGTRPYGWPVAQLTIGEVSRLIGVPVPTLRSWELRYGVVQPQVTRGGHRRYRPQDVATLQALSTAVGRGIAPRTAAQALRTAHRRDGDLPVVLLERWLHAAERCDQNGIVEALDEAERDLGLEAAVDRLLVPALRELGQRWELGLVDVGVEHLATTAARRWIATRTVTPVRLPGVGPVLLAAAAGNDHTVALEAFGMLLHCRGWPTRLLGASTPLPSLLSALRSTGATAVVVTAHQVSRRRTAVEAVAAVHAEEGVDAFYAGAAFDSERRRTGVPGTYLGTDLTRAAEVVEQALSR